MLALLLSTALLAPQFGMGGSSGTAEISVDFPVEEVGAGSVVDVQVRFEITDGWHVYHPDQNPDDGIPVSISVAGEGWKTVGPLVCLMEPELHTIQVGKFEAEYLWLSGSPEFTLPVQAPSTPGPAELAVSVGYQLCDDSQCLMSATEAFTATLTLTDAPATGLERIPSESEAEVGNGDAGAEDATAADEAPKAFGVPEQLPTDVLGFLLMAVLAGAATLLTPCVFPMIPVTISYFTKRAETGKGTPVGNAAAYAAGIVFTFAGIGGGAAVLIGPTGANQIGANPWVNTAIGVLFVVMAISLMGFFEIRPPRFLQNFAVKAQAEGQTKVGYLPVALMGVAFSITAFTCTVAFVGAVFAAGLKLGYMYLFGGMFVYGLVFALPFFFLALFPSKLQSMPNAGSWMNTVKVCAGFVELVAAIKFFSNADLFWDFELLTWPVVLGGSALFTILWALYLLGLFRMPHDYEKPQPGNARIAFGLLVLAGGLYLVPGVFKRDFRYANIIYAFAPPPTYGLPGDLGPAGLTWFEDYQEAYDHAVAEGKPLFIDFTGVTCPNCRLMENGIFPDDEVLPLLKEMVRAELWVDVHQEYARLSVERYQQASQPFYAIVDPRDDADLATFPGYDPDPSNFADFLQTGLDRYRTRVPGTE